MEEELKKVQEIIEGFENEAQNWEEFRNNEIYNETHSIFGSDGFINIAKGNGNYSLSLNIDIFPIKDFNKILDVLRSIKRCEDE